MYDFDEMVRLYQEDPEAFEQERLRQIDAFIESISDEERKQKMRQMQFRIDRELHGYKDPIARMNKMVELFWKGTIEFQQTVKSQLEGQPSSMDESVNADVLEFKPRQVD